mmetsp:Transcript_54452/g.152948  ORF Transcript_54452/g.152948 Transcript_54452/m.152948 type:complete len:389 (+) Transcript_54452:1325-2491(+)
MSQRALRHGQRAQGEIALHICRNQDDQADQPLHLVKQPDDESIALVEHHGLPRNPANVLPLTAQAILLRSLAAQHGDALAVRTNRHQPEAVVRLVALHGVLQRDEDAPHKMREHAAAERPDDRQVQQPTLAIEQPENARRRKPPQHGHVDAEVKDNGHEPVRQLEGGVDEAGGVLGHTLVGVVHVVALRVVQLHQIERAVRQPQLPEPRRHEGLPLEYEPRLCVRLVYGDQRVDDDEDGEVTEQRPECGEVAPRILQQVGPTPHPHRPVVLEVCLEQAERRQQRQQQDPRATIVLRHNELAQPTTSAGEDRRELDAPELLRVLHAHRPVHVGEAEVAALEEDSGDHEDGQGELQDEQLPPLLGRVDLRPGGGPLLLFLFGLVLRLRLA